MKDKILTSLKSFGGKLFAAFTRNIGMKLLSFVLAVLVWITIMSVSDPVITRKIDGIPIDTRNKEDFNNRPENADLSIKMNEKETLSVKVSGRRSDMENLSASDFIAYADFNDFGWVNAIPIKVEARSDNLKKKIEIPYQSKDVYRVELVKSKTDLINVVVEMVGVPEDKYALCKSVSSKLVEVTGPEERVENLEKLVAEVDVAKLVGNRQYVTLVPYDKTGEKMEDTSLEFQSSVQVEVELLPTKTVNIVIDTSETPVVNGFGIYSYDYSPKSVRIAATEDVLKTIQSISIPFESADPLYKEIKPIERDFDITKYLPEGTYLKSENTNVTVKVTIEQTGQREMAFALEDLNTTRFPLPEGFALKMDSADGKKEIMIVVEGFKKDLDAITSVEELKPYVVLNTVTQAGTEEFKIWLDSDRFKTTENSKTELTIVEQQ